LIGDSIPTLGLSLIRSVKLENSLLTVNNLYFDDILLVEEFSQSQNCPGVGKQGELRGSPVEYSRLSIEKDVNDTMIVNLNNYGDVIIRIPELQNYENKELAREIERQLSSLDIGGYPYCEVDFREDDYTFSIKSGTYGFDSSVIVKKSENSTLSDMLGFTSNIEEVSSIAGRPHAPGFDFSNSYRARTYDLNRLIENTEEDVKILYHNPELNTVEIGVSDAGETGRLNRVSGTNKTLIDFLHRATNEGLIEEVYFHGVLPRTAELKVSTTSSSIVNDWLDLGLGNLKEYAIYKGDLVTINTTGYVGNGTYAIKDVYESLGVVIIDTKLPTQTGLDVDVTSIAKIKHFRPDMQGRLSLINETQLGVEEAGEVYTRSHDTYKVDVNWYVHRGDVIGIYNAVEIYAGNDSNSNVDALYIEEEGDLQGQNIEVSAPKGAGIRGIGLYGSSSKRQTRAVYDIEFPQLENIEFFEIVGETLPKDRVYNIATAIGRGFDLQVLVEGTHVHEVFNANTALLEYITHPNIAYNVSALTDGIRFASNGLVGFEENNPNGVYCYVDGDGEWTPTDPSDDEALEFPTGGNLVHQKIIEYYNDPYEIRMTWNVPKNIHQFNLYFKEYPNAENYSLEWLRSNRETFDSEIPGFERIGLGNTSEFTKVTLDRLLLDSENLDQLEEFTKHFQTIFDNQLSEFNPEAGGTVHTFNNNPFTHLQKEFTEVGTTAIRWVCRSHLSSKMSEVELLSKTSANAGLDESLEFYFSIDGEEFQRVDPELIDSNTARFNIGFPTKYLRIVSTPGSTFALSKLYAESSDDTVRYREYNSKKPLSAISVEIEKGQESPAEKIEIVNSACEPSSVELYVETDELSDNLLLKSSMNNLQEVQLPEIGPAGVIEQDEDFKLRVTENVAINSPCYGLKNLASNKVYYVSSRFENESDLFSNGLTYGSRWSSGNFVNFPQVASDYNMWIEGGTITHGPNPGFRIQGADFSPYANPSSPINSEVRSTWNVTGSFTASINAETDSRGLSVKRMGSVLGIVDSSGRKLYIRKRSVNYDSQGGNNHPEEHIYYDIYDSSVGLLDSVQVAKDLYLNPSNSNRFGDWDDRVPYYLYLTREYSIGVDKLYFSYVDNVNGSGNKQWGTEASFELDLTTYNLIGPLKVFISHFWERQVGNTIYPNRLEIGVYPYININYFEFTGESTYSSHK
jgi:hypothetical protein